MAAGSAAFTSAVSLLCGVLAGPAYAYPPETGLSVSATPSGDTRNRLQGFSVTVSNGKPGCRLSILGGKDIVRTTIGDDGGVTVPIEVDVRHGTATITAMTVKCPGANEQASTDVTLSSGEIHGPSAGSHGQRYDFSLDTWLPRRPVSVVVTNGRQCFEFTVRPDRDGHADASFTPTRAGSWVIIAIQDGVSATLVVKVA